MVEKLTFISQATTLVDIPAVSMPIAHPSKLLETPVALCDKTAHFSGLLLPPAQGAPV